MLRYLNNGYFKYLVPFADVQPFYPDKTIFAGFTPALDALPSTLLIPSGCIPNC